MSGKHFAALGMTLVLVVLACEFGPGLLAEWALRDAARETDAARQQARDELPVDARAFADRVVAAAHDRAGPDNAALYELAGGPSVWVIARTPDLALVKEASGSYSSLFGGSNGVSACFALAFHDLGRPGARYDLTPAEPCPPWQDKLLTPQPSVS